MLQETSPWGTDTSVCFCVGVVVPPDTFGVWGHVVVVCPAASYSPTHLRVQYHQRWEA